MSLFELKNLSLSYGGPSVLQEINLRIEPGEFVGILGPNGAGKSSLLRVLAGLRSPSSGEISVDGQALASLPARERAKRIALVPQWTVMAFPYTAYEVVLMGRHPHQRAMRLESPEDFGMVQEAMRETGTLEFQDRLFGSLSGGEIQRVIVARAIAQATNALLLDEPTASLDLLHQQKIFQILRERNEAGKTVLFTTHDLNLASLHCRRVLLLEKGRIVADGKPEEVLTEKRIENIYGTAVERVDLRGRCLILPKNSGQKP